MNCRAFTLPRALTLATALIFAAAAVHAGPKHTLNLSGRGEPSEYGFGSKGLFLAKYFNSGYMEHPYLNWTWTDMTMEVDAVTGDATIAGQMVRDYEDEVWDVAINMSDVEYREESGGTYKDGGSFSGGVSIENLQALADGKDAFSEADRSTENTFGFEWKSLTLSVSQVDGSYTSAVPTEGWIGDAMPDIGHFNVAELHYDAEFGGLTFEAWYEHPDNAENDGWYRIGDTKTDATLISSAPPPPPIPVPEPGSLALAGLGLLLLARGRRSLTA